MIGKKILILAIFLVTLLAVSAVSASDNVTEDIAITDDTHDDISIDDNLGNDESNMLTTDQKTFADLNDVINGNDDSDVYLNGTYVFNSTSDDEFIKGIMIYRNMTIHGNGAILDGNYASGIFLVTSANVVLKDMVFVNAKGNLGGAIYCGGDNGVVSNCSFVNCSSETSGGVINLHDCDNIVISGCSFMNCSSKYDDKVLYLDDCDNCIVTNCNFNNCGYFDYNTITPIVCGDLNHEGNTCSDNAVIFWSGVNGIVSNCTFNNCLSVGGTIHWVGLNGTVTNCTFNNFSYYNQYPDHFQLHTIHWEGINGTVSDCSFVNGSSRSIYWKGANGVVFNCSFVNFSQNAAISWYGVIGTVSDCSFVNGSSRYIYWMGANGVVFNCSFVNFSQIETFSFYVNGSFVNIVNYLQKMAISWHGVNGTVSDCSFVNGSSSYIDWTGANGVVFNCSFVNCHYTSGGGAIYGSVVNFTISNCSFLNCYTLFRGGGAIHIVGRNNVITNCKFNNCSANTNGGAIAIYLSSYVIASEIASEDNIVSNCSFNNCYSNNGGAIYIAYGNCVAYCNFTNCIAGEEGGAIFNGSANNCIFINNSAKNGGAIAFTDAINCLFIGNNAIERGGATYGKVMVSNCTFINNTQGINENIHVNVPSKVKGCEIPVVEITLPSDANGNISVYLNGEFVTTVLVVNGKASIPLENLSNGRNIVDTFYSGDGFYLNESNTAIITKSKKTTMIVVDSLVTRAAIDYNAGERGAKFNAILKDIDGNPLANKTVQIGINGVIYKVKTDKDGKAGIQINLGSANIYTYALMFQGDDDYEATPLACSKLVLTKKSTSISAASPVSFKSTAKTKTVTVTLKTAKNRYDGKTYISKGKKITLTINGKKYSATIDGKGVAKINIGSFTKKGTFNAVIKFAGDKTYSGSSKTIKITIK